LHLVQDVDVDGHLVSIGWWLWNPSNVNIVTPELDALVNAYFFTCQPSLLELMHAGATLTTCRLATRTESFVAMSPPNHGAWTGGQADNVATGLHWLTGEGGPLRGPITFVPAVPDAFIEANWMLSNVGFGNLNASGIDLYHAFNALPAPDGTTQAVGTLHRSAAGVPMAVAQFTPYVGVNPVPKVVTIRRRIPRRRAVSP
jgi:hypothetical protein